MMNLMKPDSQLIPMTKPERSRRNLHFLAVAAILSGFAGVTNAWASDDIDIDRASWRNDTNRPPTACADRTACTW